MPQKPTMPSPYMKAVDASKPITFSCNIDSRDTIMDYEFEINEIAKTSAEKQQYILPSVFVGTMTANDWFKNKLSFYKETPQSDEYTLLVQPTLQNSGNLDQYLDDGDDSINKGGQFNIGITTIQREKITKIIYIKGTVEIIPRRCFSGFKGLKKCEIFGDFKGGNYMGTAGVAATYIFPGCNALEEVVYPNGTLCTKCFPETLKKATIYADTTLVDKNGAITTLLFSSGHKIEELIINTGNSSGSTGSISFDLRCNTVSSLKSVTFIGDRTISITDNAFYCCSNLKQFFTEMTKISGIGKKAFYKTGLETIYINKYLEGIGENAFSYCKNLSSIYIYSANEELSIDESFCSDSGVNNKINVYYLGNEAKLFALKTALENSSVDVEYIPLYNSSNFTPVPIYGGNGISSILSHTKAENTFENDKEYYWCIKLTDSLNNVITSPHYYFKTCGTSHVEIDEHLNTATEPIERVDTRREYLEVDHEIHQGSPLIVEEVFSGLMGETVENLEDDIYYYSNGKEVHRNVATSVQLKQDEDSDYYYFKLPYYPIDTTIEVSNIEAENNSISLNYIATTTDNGVTLYKFGVVGIDTTIFTKDSWYRLIYDCYFDADTAYEITYSFVEPLKGYSQSFYTVYNMENSSDRYIPVKSHRWELYEKIGTENILIDETGEIFGAYLAYKYDKFLPSKNYLLKVEVENDEGFIVSDEYEFSTATAEENTIEVMPQISLDKKHNAVILDFSECSYQNRYSVIRKDASSSKYKSIANSIAGGCKVYDYTAASNTEHIYTVYELKNGVLSVQDLEPIVPKWSNTSVIGFNGSYADKSIISVNKENVWGFGLNIGEREYSQVLSKNIVSSIGSRFAKSISGKTNYRTFSLSGYLGEIDCESKYSNDTALLSTKWDKFAASPMAKFVVDTKGHVFICDVTDSSYGYADEYAEQPTTINVSFAEIAPSDAISLVRVERGG